MHCENFFSDKKASVCGSRKKLRVCIPRSSGGTSQVIIDVNVSEEIAS